jgi:hypothetical protein
VPAPTEQIVGVVVEITGMLTAPVSFDDAVTVNVSPAVAVAGSPVRLTDGATGVVMVVFSVTVGAAE